MPLSSLGQTKVIDQTFCHQANCPRLVDHSTPSSTLPPNQVISVDSDSGESTSDSDNVSDHLLDYIDKTSMRLSRPSEVLPNVEMAVLVGDVGASLHDNSEWGGPSVDPFDMLHFMSTGGYIGEGNWKDLEVATNSERIRAVFNNGVYAVEELTQALITLEKQASEISRLKKELVEKENLLKAVCARELKIKQGFEERFRQ
ncbi:hypothetical protein LWI28_011804 [Acer negundo]|uniref:Uncharacterized protein n=1 Tax=Acer negundo TaxID=4023 RepID=A0AAD5J5H9_ACENE|nr:hypothetical protein LWI28_011804 [Acer negundo]